MSDVILVKEQRAKLRSDLAEKLSALLKAADSGELHLNSQIGNDGLQFTVSVPKGKPSLMSSASEVAAIIAEHEC